MTPWMRRYRAWTLAVCAAVPVAAAVAGYVRADSPATAAKALVAGAIAVAVALLALGLPGVTPRGLVVGVLFVTAGFFTWTYTNRPIVVWAVLGVEGVVFAVWSWPWLARLRQLPRLGTAWLGIAYWVLGVAGAVLVGHLGVAAQRVAYAGVFTLAALAVIATVRRSGSAGGDVSVGIAAAILLGTAALLLAGSATLFDSVHAVPDNPSALIMKNRFWGGPGLFFHPNSLAGLVIIAAVRIGPDRAFAAWQRLGVTAVTSLVLYLADSRIGFVFAGFAALLHAVALWRGGYGQLPEYRRRWVAALLPFAAIMVSLVLLGGQSFLGETRFTSTGGTDPTTGRLDTWRQVWTDWRHAGWAEKTFGDATTSRGVVTRADDGAAPGAPRMKLNTDNAAVGAFRRGGVLGALAFLFGLLLFLRHTVLRSTVLRGRRGGPSPPAWLAIAAVATLPTILTEDWMLGGTNGALWMVLLAGEAYLLWSASNTVRPEPEGDLAGVTAPPAPPIEALPPRR